MDEATLLQKRDALIAKIADAYVRLESGDKSITYQSISEMEKALRLIDGELQVVTGVARGRMIRLTGRSGL